MFRFHFIVERVICVSDRIWISLFVFLSAFFPPLFSVSVAMVVFLLCTSGFGVQLFYKPQFLSIYLESESLHFKLLIRKQFCPFFFFSSYFCRWCSDWLCFVHLRERLLLQNLKNLILRVYAVCLAHLYLFNSNATSASAYNFLLFL